MDTRRIVVLVLVSLFLLAPVYALTPDGGEAPVILSGSVAVILLAAYLVLGGDEERDNSDSWNPIPSRQYEGRYAELGGLTREEEALRDVQEKAEEIDGDKN